MEAKKICLYDGKEIIQRENENNYRYQRRKFCSQYCYNKYMRTNKLGWYANFPNPAPETEPTPLTDETIVTTTTVTTYYESSIIKTS